VPFCFDLRSFESLSLVVFETCEGSCQSGRELKVLMQATTKKNVGRVLTHNFLSELRLNDKSGGQSVKSEIEVPQNLDENWSGRDRSVEPEPGWQPQKKKNERHEMNG
jgi:hypothetical protein